MPTRKEDDGRRTEAVLRQRERQLAESQRLAHLGSWEWDVATDTVSWSAELYNIFGLPPQEFGASYAAVLERLHPDDRERWRNEVEQARLDARSFRFEHRIVRPDGTIRTLQACGEALTDDEGRVTRMFGTAQDITEQKQAGEALRESEERFSQLLLAAFAGVGISENARLVEVSPGFAAMFGYLPAEMMGKPVAELVAPEFAADALDKIRRDFEQPYESVCIRKDGSRFPVEVCGKMITYHGRRARMAAVRDITGRKRAEEQVRERENELRLVMNTVPALMSYMDAEFRYRRVNQSYERWFGLTVREMEGRAVREVLGEAAWQLARPRLERAMAGETVTFEELMPYRLGPRWMAATLVPDRDATGRVQGLVVLVTDITERKQTEEALREAHAVLERRVAERTAELRTANQALQESEERFRNAFMNAMTGVALVAPNGRFLHVNRALCEMGGYSATELLQLDFQALIHPADVPSIVELLQRMVAGELSTAEVEKRYFDKQSRVKWARINASLVRDAADKPLYFVGHVQDVTERKRLEQAISEVREREQQRIAEDLHDSLGQRLTGVAFLCKALEQKLAKKSRTAAAEAKAITELVTTAIAHTKDLARSLYPVELEANGLVAALQELATNTSELFRMDCAFKCREALLVEDRAAATQLYRIAQEAVSNAVRHGNPGQIQVSLSRTGSTIVLVIHDDGTGFTPGHTATGGIGLQIMAHRAQSMGASLEVESRPGHGATVTCRWNSAG